MIFMKFSCKVFKKENEVLLAICDPEILGKTFEEEELHIEVKRDFYHEKFVDENDVLSLIKNATIVNAVGKETINLLLKNKYIKKECVIEIKGVPHAQIITI